VDALPDEWREPFVLFRYEDMSCADVADAMGLTPKAVEMRLRSAVRALSARLGRQAERGGNGRP
jgi:RNA polymerase sigma-70 factor (ECF subfamily)